MSPTYLVFLGSARDSLPPLPARLGLRVARALISQLQHRGAHAVLVDLLNFDLGRTFKPHFAYVKDSAPAALYTLAEQIALADGCDGQPRIQSLDEPSALSSAQPFRQLSFFF